MAVLPDVSNYRSETAAERAQRVAAQRALQEWGLADVVFLAGERRLRDDLAKETDPTGLQDRYAPRVDEMSKAADRISHPELRAQWLAEQRPRFEEQFATINQRADDLEYERVVREVTAPLTLIEQARWITDDNAPVRSADAASDLRPPPAEAIRPPDQTDALAKPSARGEQGHHTSSPADELAQSARLANPDFSGARRDGNQAQEENPPAQLAMGVRDWWRRRFPGLQTEGGAGGGANRGGSGPSKTPTESDGGASRPAQQSPDGSLGEARSRSGGNVTGRVPHESPASSFSGSLRAPLQAPDGPPRNPPGEFRGVPYSGHAFDQMQNRGIPPHVIDQTIKSGVPRQGDKPGSTRYYDSTNNMSVIRDDKTGNIITIRPGD